MGKQTIVRISCDAKRCLQALEASNDEQEREGREVDTTKEYLQAGVYSFYAHKECFLNMTPVEVCKALGVDVEVEIRDRNGQATTQERVWTRWS